MIIPKIRKKTIDTNKKTELLFGFIQVDEQNGAQEGSSHQTSPSLHPEQLPSLQKLSLQL